MNTLYGGRFVDRPRLLTACRLPVTVAISVHFSVLFNIFLVNFKKYAEYL